MPPYLQLGTAKARTGQKVWGQWLIKEGKKQVRLPVVVVNGGRPGRHILIMANQHGNELNGIESIRYFIEELNPKELRGTIFAIPSANPYAAMAMNSVWTENDKDSRKRGGGTYKSRYNLYFAWPGKKGGLLVERAAYEIWNRAVMAPFRKACAIIDLHCHQAPTAIYAQDWPAVKLGIITGIRNIIYTRDLNSPERPLHQSAAKAGVHSLLVELEGQGVMNSAAIEIGRSALFNILKCLGMLPGRPVYRHNALIIDPWKDSNEKNRPGKKSYMQYIANHAGLVHFYKQRYDLVRKTELVCEVINPFTGGIAEQCRAPMAGIIYAMPMPHPACQKGTVLFNVSTVRQVRPADYIEQIKSF